MSAGQRCGVHLLARTVENISEQMPERLWREREREMPERESLFVFLLEQMLLWNIEFECRHKSPTMSDLAFEHMSKQRPVYWSDKCQRNSEHICLSRCKTLCQSVCQVTCQNKCRNVSRRVIRDVIEQVRLYIRTHVHACLSVTDLFTYTATVFFSILSIQICFRASKLTLSEYIYMYKLFFNVSWFFGIFVRLCI